MHRGDARAAKSLGEKIENLRHIHQLWIAEKPERKKSQKRTKRSQKIEVQIFAVGWKAVMDLAVPCHSMTRASIENARGTFINVILADDYGESSR
jgi:hypothetical protein